MRARAFRFGLVGLVLSGLWPMPVMAARLKDITSVIGVRDNQLIGYGLVIGLAGTGDGLKGSPFTEQSIRSMLEKMGVTVPVGSIRARNVAAVIVTSTLPPYAARGARIDVSVSSMGDASSLRGGMLLVTPLLSVDGKVYAVAQGPLTVSGFEAKGEAESVKAGVPTSGRIPNGALIEREVIDAFNDKTALSFQVTNPDFNTAISIADAINAYAKPKFGRLIATADDMRTIRVDKPDTISATRLVAELGDLGVTPDSPARIVIDERTGTIVIGADVRISRVAVTHGTLTVRVTEMPDVSQPLPDADGETVIVPETNITTRQSGGQLSVVGGASLDKLVDGLNRLGLKPPGIIAIIQSIKAAGALHAELVVE